MSISVYERAQQAVAAFEKARADLTAGQLAFNYRQRLIRIYEDFDRTVADIRQALAAIARPIDEEQKLALAPLEEERRAQRRIVTSNHNPAEDYQSEMMTGVDLLTHKLAALDDDFYKRSREISQPFQERKAAAQRPFLEQLRPFEEQRAKQQAELTQEYLAVIGPTYRRVSQAWIEMRDALQGMLLEVGGWSVRRVDIDLDLSWRDDSYHYRLLAMQTALA